MQNAKQQILYPALSAIITSAVIGAGALIFSAQKENIDEIYIEYNSINIEHYISNDIFLSYNLSEKYNNHDMKTEDYIPYPRTRTLTAFKISNESNAIAENLYINFNDYLYAYITNNEDKFIQKIETNQGKTIEIDILPRKYINLYVVYRNNLSILGPDERFIFQGKEIVPKEINQITNGYSLFDDLYNDISEYSEIVLTLSLLGFVLLFSMIMLLTLHLLTRNNPELFAKDASDQYLARSLALINYIKTNNPNRFHVIVKLAEKFHHTWNNPEQ
ncbi:MAG: hypothetical protein RLW87_21510 [Alphaproteobacteria bacterium]